jgi:hypothetical protein
LILDVLLLSHHDSVKTLARNVPPCASVELIRQIVSQIRISRVLIATDIYVCVSEPKRVPFFGCQSLLARGFQAIVIVPESEPQLLLPLSYDEMAQFITGIVATSKVIPFISESGKKLWTLRPLIDRDA